MSAKEYIITVKSKKYTFKLENNKLEYCPDKKEEKKSTTDKNEKDIVIPNIIVVTRKTGEPLFALEPDKKDSNQFEILTAQQLYDIKKIQWFEPLADNYRELIWLNEKTLEPNSDVYVAYKHFTWNQIIEFSLVDRLSVSFASGFRGDWKKSSKGADGYLLVTVGEKPYWADAIGQIPYSVDTMRDYIMKYKGNKYKAIKKTIITGIKHGDGGVFFAKEDSSNGYDNYMILRACLWSCLKFEYVTTKHLNMFETHEIKENAGNFEYKLSSPITKVDRDKYAQWEYKK
jgi:hypothetical protein